MCLMPSQLTPGKQFQPASGYCSRQEIAARQDPGRDRQTEEEKQLITVEQLSRKRQRIVFQQVF